MRARYLPIAALALVAECSTASALLAPNYQRRAELQAVLAHPGVIGAFKVRQPIDRVEYLGKGLYRVTAGECHIDVAIVNKPRASGSFGAVHFIAEPGRPVCR